MSQRMIVIPWEEYNRLKGAIDGKGSPHTAPVKTDTDPIALAKDTADPTVSLDRESSQHQQPAALEKGTDPIPVEKEQRLKGPPGLPASKWLPWT